jgi:hypothetical protein
MNSSSNIPSCELRAIAKGPRDGSGQAHSTVKMPVRKEANTSIQLLNLYGLPVVNI